MQLFHLRLSSVKRDATVSAQEMMDFCLFLLFILLFIYGIKRIVVFMERVITSWAVQIRITAHMRVGYNYFKAKSRTY